MNKKKALALLCELLATTQIQVHPDMLKELLALIAHSGEEAKVLKLLAARLLVLGEQKNTAQLFNREFEHLERGIYSMHISTQTKNIRILYAFRDPDTILLLAFHERAGKSKTDYTGKIDEALHRLYELTNE